MAYAKTKRWLRGLLSAVIRGGAHSITPAGVVTVIDPKDFNPLKQCLHFLALVGSTFVVSGTIELFRYLDENPLPDFDTAPPFPVDNKTADEQNNMNTKRSSLLTSILLSGALLLSTFNLQAQAPPPLPSAPAPTVDTNVPPVDALIGGPASSLLTFLGTGSNWMVAPYGIVSTDSKIGGGVAVGYKISEFVVPIMRLDYYDGTVWMPSASLQLQAPLNILGKLTVIPFAFAGIATPLAGRGADNGSAVGIFGAGGAVRFAKHWDVVADVEKWSGFKGQQMRFGVLYKF